MIIPGHVHNIKISGGKPNHQGKTHSHISFNEPIYQILISLLLNAFNMMDTIWWSSNTQSEIKIIEHEPFRYCHGSIEENIRYFGFREERSYRF